MKANAIFDSIRQGILICDKKACIVYFNDEYAKYIGHSLEEVRGQKLKKYKPDALALSVISSGEKIEGALKHQGENDYYANIYPILEDNQVTGSISVVTSLSQRHKKQDDKSKLTLAERVKRFEQEEILIALEKYGTDTEGKKQAAEALGISLATLYNKLNG